MNAHVPPPASVVRFPPRLRAVSLPGNPASALDALLSAGTIDRQQHAAGLAYAALRLRHDTAKHGGGGLSPERWAAVKRDHAALLTAAGFDRFLLDRLCLDDGMPLRCEVGRVRAALGRVALTIDIERGPAPFCTGR